MNFFARFLKAFSSSLLWNTIVTFYFSASNEQQNYLLSSPSYPSSIFIFSLFKERIKAKLKV